MDKLKEQLIHLLESPPITGRTKDYAGMVNFTRLADLILALIKQGEPSLKVLSDEQIIAKLREIQPEGFNWTDITRTESMKFYVIAQAQRDYDQTQLAQDKGEV